MAEVVAVEFAPHGVLHYLDPAGFDLHVGDQVLFPSESGGEVCRVVWVPESADVSAAAVLPRCLGFASAADLARDARNRRIRAESQLVAERLIAQRGLDMRVVGVDYVDQSDTFDHQVVIYFQAPGRVDFRALLGDLARTLRSRIDLRQIASRDAARIIGGVGKCGRDLCCTTFLDQIDPVSMRVARAQGLPANPLQISGPCGRLLCCLHYEQDVYAEFNRQAPPLGQRVQVDGGIGKVVGHSAPSSSVDVRMKSGEVVRCPLASVCVVSRKLRSRRDG